MQNEYLKSLREKNSRYNQESYFEDEDDEKDAIANSSEGKDGAPDDDSIDPLDAFMAGVVEQVDREKDEAGKRKAQPLPEIVSQIDEDRDYDRSYTNKKKRARGDDANDDDDDDDDDIDSYDGNGPIEYDSDGNPLPEGEVRKKTKIEPLPPIDHSKITYPTFRKNFYTESTTIASKSPAEVKQIRHELMISVMGGNEGDDTSSKILNPISSFSEAGFDSKLLAEIMNAGFESPTAIQCQTLPLALAGNDIIGVANTGSGKTMAFLWPMIVHILDQPQMNLGDGPIGLVLAPTRELALQIFTESKRFCKLYNIRVCSVIGGSVKYEMAKSLKETCPEIVIATPGRLIDMVKSKATNLARVTFVVLDEADRHFEMGFEYQVRSILSNIRPNRQTLMFSATMKKRIEGLAREILTNPIRVVVGTIGQANPDINQVVHVLHDDASKLHWLMSRISSFLHVGKVLVFCLGKKKTEEVAAALLALFKESGIHTGVEVLHGDKDQIDRNSAMKNFRSLSSSTSSSASDVLIATDIAARGLDIKNIRTVINFEAPKNIETYVHRIGRTGRLNVEGIQPGTAISLLTKSDSSFAVDLVQNLTLSKQPVPEELKALAQTDPKWGRYLSFKKGGGGAKFEGLGHGGNSSHRQMNSAMMANESAMAGQGSNSYLNSAVSQKYYGSSSSSSFSSSSSSSSSSSTFPSFAGSENKPASAPGKSRWDT